MDCGTCPSSEAVTIEVPKAVQCNVSMSESAVKMLSDAFGEDRTSALLVGVLSGGCSGYMYDLQIVEETDVDCQEHMIEGFRVLIPNHASHMLDGIRIDYIDRLMGGGFKIENPSADRSCGCGESFG
ncbi:MAG TPA: iron-sulfur cluster assembly accessory protein [Candidatus Poseidoniales archaeon]|jgi:iron-sulfur cluster assembly protein|nr:iron-sulfur cluster assembly accessory protein [Candidatus Poseidoniales archaeon]